MNLRAAASILLLLSAPCVALGEESLTREQGDAILQELRNIRTLLERQQQAPRPAAVPAPAAPEFVKVKLGKEFSQGNANAPVVMVEFTDLQCPFCGRFHSGAYTEIKKQYIDTGKVRYIARDLPLEDLHPQALRAALAARCAGDQGKFWEASSRIFANQAGMSPQSIDAMVKETGVDAAKYQACVDSGRYVDEIKASAAAAQSLGISGTPSFVIGKVKGDTLEGQKLVGAMPFNLFDNAIKEALAR